MASQRILACGLALIFFGGSARAKEIVFASYNLENYFVHPHESGGAKTAREISAVINVIKEVNPDILGVCEMGLREDFEDFKQRLKDAGLGYSDFEYLEAADTERHVALLSRLPINSRQSVADIPYELNGHHEKVKRGFLDVTIKTGEGSDVRFVGVHLKSKRDTAEGEALMRRNEAHLFRQHLEEVMTANPQVKLLAYGDCNDTKDQPPLHEITGARDSPNYLTELLLKDKLGDRWTHFWKTADIYSRIDYIFVNRALLPDVVKDKCSIYRSDHWNEASDHRPVIAIFRVTN